MLGSLIKGFKEQNQQRDYDRGWDYAQEQHRKFGDEYLETLERQAYGQDHKFDQGIRDYVFKATTPDD